MDTALHALLLSHIYPLQQGEPQAEEHGNNRHLVGGQMGEVFFYPRILGGHDKGGYDSEKYPEHFFIEAF